MSDPTYLLLNLFSLLGVTFAAWKGNRAERIAAAVVVVNLLVGVAAELLIPGGSSVVRLANDGLAALALLAVTVRYGALWMGGVMLFYAAQFSLHSIYMVTDRSDRDYLHALVNNIDFSGVTWCLIIGTAMAWRQRERAARAQKAAP
jgi:cbb3-type cytochrome oxidase subunit 3